MLLQQETFENIVAKEEPAPNEQFLLLPQCFQIYLIFFSFTYKKFQYLCLDIFKVLCCRFVECVQFSHVLTVFSSPKDEVQGELL